MKRTLKRELKGLEVVKSEAMATSSTKQLTVALRNNSIKHL